MGKIKLSKDKKILVCYEGKCPEEIVIPDGVEIIEEGAFEGKNTLKKVKLSSSVATIKARAFAKTGVEKVTLPASVSSVATDAFTYMTLGRQKYGSLYETPSALKVDKNNPYYYADTKCLYKVDNKELVLVLCFKGGCSSVEVTGGTVRIKSGAFRYCRYLSGITLPDTLTTLDDRVFEGLPLETLYLPAKTTEIGESEFSYMVNNISEYSYFTEKFSSTKIIVDENNPVYASVNNCFIKRDGEKVVLLRVIDKDKEALKMPSDVTHINCGAFNEWKKLKEVSLSDNLIEISDKAFKRCICIEKITLPESLKNIGSEAFSNCTKLVDVAFKNGDVAIEDNAFDGCKKTKIFFNCPEGSKAAEYAKANKINIAGAKNSDNPAEAFRYTISKNKTVKINAYISDSDKVIIPGSIEGCTVVAFNKDVFKNNQKIKSVVWPVEIPVLPKEIFNGCSSLERVVLPDGVTEISEKTFRNCRSLKNIFIPATVTTIHETAFECAENTIRGWEYWNSVEVINGVNDSYAEEFAKNAEIKFFHGDISAEEQAAMNLYSYHEVADGIALDDFVITDDMTVVKTMFGKSYLSTLEIPNEILGKPVVELSADFHKKKKRRGDSVEYDDVAETLIIPENLKRIRCPLERRCIKNVNVSSNNTSLVFDDFAWYEDGGETFTGVWVDGYYNVDEYKIREGTIRASSEFKWNVFIDRLFFPETFVEFYDSFLKNGWGLGVKKIYAFNSSGLQEFVEKYGVEFVALDAQEIAFSEDGLALVSFPRLLAVKKYVVPDGIRYIEKEAFKGNEFIEEIIIPDTVENIGEGAFLGCIALEKVALPDGIKELPDRLFEGCKKLSDIKWPSSVTKIGKKCFSYTGLRNVVVPGSVTEIGDYAFASEMWSKVKIDSIEIPQSVQKIGVSICAGAKDIIVYDSIDTDSKPAKDFYDDENGEWNSRVGCMGIYQYENYATGACNSCVCKHSITVKSAVDSAIKYKVLMYGDEEPRNVYCAMVSSWGINADFNFVRIDEKFSKLTDIDNRLETVLNRLEYPIDLTDKMKEKYHSWLRRNAVKVLGTLIEKGDLEGLMSFEKYGVITKSNIEKLVNLAISSMKVEISAYLLDLSAKL